MFLFLSFFLFRISHFCVLFFFFFFNDTATTEIYTLSLHDALPISLRGAPRPHAHAAGPRHRAARSEEHTSELQSLRHLVCRLLLEKKKKKKTQYICKKKKKKIKQKKHRKKQN